MFRSALTYASFLLKQKYIEREIMNVNSFIFYVGVGGWGGMGGGGGCGVGVLTSHVPLVSERPATFGTRPKIKLQCINKIYYSWSYICVIPLSYSTFWIFFVRFANQNIGLVMNHWTISIDAMCFNIEYCLETTSFFRCFFCSC